MHNKIRKLLVTSYNMDYPTWCKVMGLMERDYYAVEKFCIFQRDFARWYCELDEENSKRFVEYVLGGTKS